ncbi:hypothetical protein KGF54_002311 [Candida jiufengensis]|uniref:uncharacterized protein n=1 Tax=Candida jiufengensis TaxID=497108 RepID=UPI00222433D1|nr:uncharacterized protein KGF54_002311 [Candida jiufengensis]KAI5954536.1 hypothetical protein KGF54_002311 [Candida jiufengensis]
MDLNYRTYQQVLNIAVKPTTTQNQNVSTIKKLNSSKKITKPTKIRKDESQIKRRTKTGCFTCRKRKKKCDEDKVNGKCQACTRNFLDCCWPEPVTKKETQPKELKEFKEIKSCTNIEPTTITRSTKCDINSLLASPINQQISPITSKRELLQQQITPEPEPQQINPYPSPIQSPVSTFSHPNSPTNNISYMNLPPLNFNYKLHAKDSNVRGSKEENIEESKFQINLGTQITSNNNNSQVNSVRPVENKTRFIISSFNSRKALCDIKN